jgi:hypothetical protein
MLTPLNNPVLRLKPVQKLIWLYLSQQEDYTPEWKIETSLGIGLSSVRLHMNSLEEMQIVQCADSGAKGTKRSWKIK